MVIIVQSTYGMPVYYAPDQGRTLGTPHGWSSDRNQALHFGRAKDAEAFAGVFLPNVAPLLTFQEHNPQ